jgi:hypothetical protein
VISKPFFIPFSFSKRHRRQLEALGVGASALPGLESSLAELKTAFKHGWVPNRVQERHDLSAMAEGLEALVNIWERTTDTSALDWLNADAGPKAGVNIRELIVQLSVYRDSARKGANRKVSGRDMTRKQTLIAEAVGRTLEKIGIALDAKLKGPFVLATAIVFKAMDIHKSEPRNDVRRVLKALEKAER